MLRTKNKLYVVSKALLLYAAERKDPCTPLCVGFR